MDNFSKTSPKFLRFNINNLNDNSPSITSNNGHAKSILWDENLSTSDIVYDVNASDSDGDLITYSLFGGDASSFDISPFGEITFKQRPNYETNKTRR